MLLQIWEDEKLQNIGLGMGAGSGVMTFDNPNSDQTEEDKLSNMMINSSEMYDPKNWIRYKGKAAYGGGAPPKTYKCNKCQQPGHWVQDCPTGSRHSDMKRNMLRPTTGIPRSFLKPATKDTLGVKVNPQGKA